MGQTQYLMGNLIHRRRANDLPENAYAMLSENKNMLNLEPSIDRMMNDLPR
jgi:hypothetical protein